MTLLLYFFLNHKHNEIPVVFVHQPERYYDCGRLSILLFYNVECWPILVIQSQLVIIYVLVKEKKT